MSQMIRLKRVNKIYSGQRVLENITMEVPEGLISCVIGPNGAGKSTLIKIITGFEFPEEGEVYYGKVKIRNFKDVKHIMSYMPESMVLYPDYFVGEFLEFLYSATGSFDGDLMEALSLRDIFDKRIRELSKGWSQRLKLYTALSSGKPLAVLDEPFEGFDPLQMRAIAGILRAQNERGRTFLLSIHQLSYAQKISDYYFFLDRGRLIAEGTLEELSERFDVPQQDLEEIFMRAARYEA